MIVLSVTADVCGNAASSWKCPQGAVRVGDVNGMIVESEAIEARAVVSSQHALGPALLPVTTSA